jgi:regulator of protease activity HflC (stomatin/prohibitin superfamily)
MVGLLFLRKIIIPEPITIRYPFPVGAAMLLLALLSFLLARLELAVGEQEGSAALVADSFHSRVDMFNSLVVAGALLGEGLGLSLDRVAAGLLAAFILSQAVNVFGAVIRDMSRKEGQPEYLYREWLWLAIEKRLPGIIPAIITRAVMLMGGSPDSPRSRRWAGAIITAVVMGGIVLCYLASGFFTVSANEQAFVERLGKPLNIKSPLRPGLHWRRPWPLDRVRKVDVTGIRRLNVGSIVVPDRRTLLWTNQHYLEQFNLLSGENIFVDVGVVIHYRVADAAAWLYNTRNPESLLSAITSSELTETFSRMHFLDTVTAGRNELEAELTSRIKQALVPFQAGIEILSVQVRDAHPPLEVAPDFERVVSAAIEYETKINVARGYQNDLIPRARGPPPATGGRT